MKAAELQHRINVYSQNKVDDGCAGQTETFTLKGACFAEIKPISLSSEQYIDRRIADVADHEIKTRHNIGFTFLPTDIIKFGTRIFRIQGILNHLESNFMYRLKCLETYADIVVVV